MKKSINPTLAQERKNPSISHLMRVCYIWDFFQFLLYSVYNAIMVLPRWNLVHLLILQSIHLSCCKIGRQFLTPCFCNQNTTTKAGHVFLLLVKITVIYSHKSNLELGKLKASKIKKKNVFHYWTETLNMPIIFLWIFNYKSILAIFAHILVKRQTSIAK